MAIPITIPRLGWNMDEGVFAGWTKQEGEQVTSGDSIFTLESDKALQEVESLDAGILRISPGSPKAGEKVAVGTIIGYLVAPGESPPVAGPVPAPSAPGAPAPAGRVPPAPETAPSAPEEHLQAVSPRASRLAAELGVDCTRLKGSGRGGRITEEDVRAAAAASPPPAKPVGAFRQSIAERMMLSARSTAPVTVTTQVDAGALVEARERLKVAPLEGILTPSYTEILVKLAGLALQDHPALLGRWEEGRILPASGVHVGIAVDTPEGLVVPVVRDVPALPLLPLSRRCRELVERARSRSLTPQDMAGGTFTVTNLGAFGVDAFTPIIHYPQCAILGIGRIDRQPVVREDRVVPGHRMTLSLTFDHRIVDGAPAARFLAALSRWIENPRPAF
ncbi:MAG TPA: dihydrolipoamide acetyltransferase family protein [Planctomycetota bacterium]|nr:dihydrolipoamide acetyltransferase family protein [Planctomycetota bacterium]